MPFQFPHCTQIAVVSVALLTSTTVTHAQSAAEINATAQSLQAAQAAMSRFGGAAATPTATPQATPAPSAQPVGPKKPGAVRIGIFMPQYDLGGPGGPTAGESVRTVEEQFLTGPKIEVIRISALLPIQATAEAKEKQCDYVLVSSLSQKKSAGGFGALKTLSAATPMAAMIPGAGMAAMAASQSLAIASSTAVMASSGVKAKSEVSFEYSLNSPDETSVLRDAQKSKAKTDGEDVVTPMIQKAATNIVTLLNK
jgi:hypothetical protein